MKVIKCDSCGAEIGTPSKLTLKQWAMMYKTNEDARLTTESTELISEPFDFCEKCAIKMLASVGIKRQEKLIIVD